MVVQQVSDKVNTEHPINKITLMNSGKKYLFLDKSTSSAIDKVQNGKKALFGTGKSGCAAYKMTGVLIF